MAHVLPTILVTKKEKTAQKFIAAYIKLHAIPTFNVLNVIPVKTELSIDEIRSIKKDLVYADTSPRIVVIYGFEKASLEAQNALLKSLEEHNESIHYLLVTSHIHGIIPTVLSRSKIITLDSSVAKKENQELINVMEKVKNANDLSFLGEKEFSNLDREKASELMTEMLLYFESKLQTDSSKAVVVLKKITEVKNLLENNNLHPQLTIDNLLIYIAKRYTMKNSI